MILMKNKLIIYDSNCKVCVGLRDLMLAFSLIKPEECSAYLELAPGLRQQVRAERFRNEMALVDTRGGETLYGAAGVALILSEKVSLLRYLFQLKIFLWLFRFLYKTLAYNRYVIATPRQQGIACDCYPQAATAFRLTFLFLAIALSVLLTALFGVSVHEALGQEPGAAAGQLLLMAGTGWGLQLLLAACLLERQQALDYAGHLGTLMVCGLLVLVPGMLFYFISGLLYYLVPVLSVLASSLLMLYLHYYRVQFLGLSQRWTWQWFLLLQFSAAGWIWYFYF